MKFLAKPRRILITGASRGIGRATALALAERGHSLVLAARGREALESVAEQIRRSGGNAQAIALDVTNTDSVNRGIAEALASGPLDVLVNNAGSCQQREFLRSTDAQLAEEMSLNYFGAQHMIRALLPTFVQQRSGLIVNVSSLVGSSAAPTTANYSASKAALEAFSHALRGELARCGVRVTVFVAPHTQTELGERTEFRGVTSLPVAYVARELVHAIDRAPRRYAASPVYRLLLRLAAWFPRMMERQMLACVQHLLTEPAVPERGRAQLDTRVSPS
ncbi:MAG TPA: SDR family NAD(P)-dependent oxidoreductase [Polyangiaceae bacterium]|nr:SDR family NAD(P)-dependent oxidoreductase [Polyangiaceae bacterium]